MTLTIERQVALPAGVNVPERLDLQRAANAAFSAAAKSSVPYDREHVVTVRIVSPEESRQLNRDWRGKDAPTNVLAFPAPPSFVANDEVPHAGDLVICAAVVARESAEQGKAEDFHWAHMVVHGCLHLMGYDHIEQEDAVVMEAIERDAMQCLGLPDPYL